MSLTTRGELLTTYPDHRDQHDDFVPTEELARRQGVTPIASVDELAQPDLRESEAEYEEFLRVPPRRPGVTDVVVDTDVASAILKGRLPDDLAAQLAGRQLAVTFVTVGELTQ